jgi:hypothetical protein
VKKEYNLEHFSKLTWSLVVIKNGKIIYKSKMRRLKPLIFCIKKFGKVLRGAVVFDRNVGQASAMLLNFAKVKEIWTPTVSVAGKKFLEKNKIKLEYFKIVKSINREDGQMCPMEKMSEDLGEKAFLQKMLG